VGERAEDQFRVAVKVGRVPGHQRDAAARGDNSGSNEKLVDPVQDARFAAADAGNHGDGLLEWESLLHRHPFFVAEIRRFNRGFRCQSVVASDGDVQGFEQEWLNTHRRWPWRAADQPMREDEVVVRGEWEEILLGHVEIAQPDVRLAGAVQCGDQQLATCAALFSAASLFYGDSIPQFLAQLDPARGMLFLYLVLACTVFAFFVQLWAVRRTSPSRVSLLLGTEPIWGAIIGIAIAHDSLALGGYCGIAFILAGTAWGRSVEQSHRLAPHPLHTRSRRNTESQLKVDTGELKFREMI
jgi:hypothetical protein